MPKKFIIGTRGSLLALTQSQQIKQQLEDISGREFELKVIQTQGDQITDKPLWQLEGKDFFTKELDEALINKDVDLVVHSYKDLGSDRPKEIKLAAITERKYPHDVLLIKKDTLEEFKNSDEDKPFIVGTSSPRRIYNIKNQLTEFLPFKGIKLETQTLRGNVNTRIEKLLKGNYHAIVLAFAGLERLAQSEDSAKILKGLLKDLTFMIMPTSVFPSAASQGALAVECLNSRDDNNELDSYIGRLNHEKTIREVNQERKAFKEYGGGCHLAIGINARLVRSSLIITHRGIQVDNVTKSSRHVEVDDIHPPIGLPSKVSSLFVGLPEYKLSKYKTNGPKLLSDKLTSKKSKVDLEDLSALENGSHNILYTSTYCFECLNRIEDIKSLWTAGTFTMKSLAQNGYWVNGCLDSLGELEAEKIKSSKFLGLFNLDLSEETKVLTYKDSQNSMGEIIGSYERTLLELSQEEQKELEKCDHFFWTSFRQFQDYQNLIPDLGLKNHYCGMGTTYEQFAKSEIKVRPFKNISHLLNIIQESEKN